jgi:2-hydroxychromene-2-carboxylate isomerase
MRASGPAFYFDLASPDAYLAAERVIQALPVAAEWIPVLARELPGAESFEAFRCAEERAIVLGEYERRTAERGLQPLRWPEPFPFESALAMRAATYAKSIGKVVPYALAAFRQAFAGGRALDREDNVVIAASACEMHPRAVLQGAATRGTSDALARATALAAERGVRDVPAVWTGERAFHGDRELERAAAALAERVAAR